MDSKGRVSFLACFILLLLVFTGKTFAAPVSEQTAWLVARNFITRHVAAHDGWMGYYNPTPSSVELVRYKGEPLAYNVSVNPHGHLLVAYYDDFSPVLFYSPSSALDPLNADDPNAIESWIIPEIYKIVLRLKGLSRPAAVAATVGEKSLEASGKSAAGVADRINAAWSMLTETTEHSDPLSMKAAAASGTIAPSVGPLLTTSWSQSPYYNHYTPAASGCTHTLTGCVATAAAQIMKYWNWPVTGTGNNSYSWNGITLSANFSHPYDWSSMPAALNDSSTPSQIDSVALLMSDLGISLNMEYGCAISGTRNRVDLETYFRYKPTTYLAKGQEDAGYGHTGTLLPNGKVLFAGGGLFDRSDLYDPATGRVSPTGNMAFRRAYHTSTLLPNGKVLTAGGAGDSPLGSAELYDPAAGSFSATSDMTTARLFHTATLLPDGKVLFAGGSGNGGVLKSTEVYDPATGVFSASGEMSTARARHTATLLPNGKVLFAGGINYAGVTSSAELYDPATGRFSAIGDMPSERYSHTATLLSNGKALIAGGSGNAGSLGSAELYDPVSGSFSATGSMTAARKDHAATLLANGKVLTAGGQGDSLLRSAELYDPATGTFSATSEMNFAWSGVTGTLLPNGKVLISNRDLYDPATGLFSAVFDPDWMSTIKGELNAANPRVILFEIIGNGGHAVVIDGYQTDVSGTDQVHINYGWGGGYDGFYDITSNWSAGYDWSPNHQSIVIGIEPAGGAPEAPTNVTAAAGNSQATVSFAAPPFDGGSAITGYTVTSSPAGGVDVDTGTTALTHTIKGLTNGTAYTFTVTATNTIGTGPASPASNSVTPVSQLPDLMITKSHNGNFLQGQVGANYIIWVTNVGTASTTGTVTVSDKLPTGLEATAISGSGWNCNFGTLACTRSTALAAGASYAPIILTVKVAVNASSPVTNRATVSGGGQVNTSNDTVLDLTTITPAVTAMVGSRGFPSVQSAYDDPSTNTGAVIKLLGGVSSGSLLASRGIAVLLVGGYNAAYSASTTEGTEVVGPLLMRSGTLRIKNVRISQ